MALDWTRPRWWPGMVALAALVLALALAADASAGSTARPQSAEAAQLTIDNFAFSPKSMTVPAGTTVTWVNHDDVPHTVTAADRSFSSTALDTDDTFSYQFATPGTYRYFCALHPKMTGEIVVE